MVQVQMTSLVCSRSQPQETMPLLAQDTKTMLVIPAQVKHISSMCLQVR